MKRPPSCGVEEETIDIMASALIPFILFILFVKVTLKQISNNWNVSLKDSETVLNKWLTAYKNDRPIVKEFLIRGTDLNGNCVISVSIHFIQPFESHTPQHSIEFHCPFASIRWFPNANWKRWRNCAQSIVVHCIV